MDIVEAQNGDKKARNQFILENQGLVKSVAVKYNVDNKYDIDDLISEGNIGLMNAIERFDPNRGFNFSTYAVYWIKKMIQEYIRMESKSVHITCWGYRKLSKFRKSLMDLTDSLNRMPSFDEIAEYTHIDVDDLKALIESEYKFPSIDAIFDANNNVVVESLYDNGSDDPMDLYESYEKLYEVRNLLFNSNLNEKQLQVLLLKYGFYGDCKTLEYIGDLMGISRQRVGQHVTDALKKLRKSENFKKLDGYGILKK